jgi:CRISPR/Cas system CMR subunit Cmr4 (Cas7 group RAMP superfamily)
MKRLIEVEIHSYWHVGTGRGGGVGADALQFKDQNRLPIWPGKSIKGVFRDAFRQGQVLGVVNDQTSWMTELFGPEVSATSDDVPDNKGDIKIRFQNTRGNLRFSDARMAPPAEYAEMERWLNDPEYSNQRVLPYLYSEVVNIRLQEDGVVADGAMRLIELTKPVTLFAEIEYKGASEEATKAFDALEKVFPLIRLIGASRTRGLGRVSVRFLDAQGEG